MKCAALDREESVAALSHDIHLQKAALLQSVSNQRTFNDDMRHRVDRIKAGPGIKAGPVGQSLSGLRLSLGIPLKQGRMNIVISPEGLSRAYKSADLSSVERVRARHQSTITYPPVN